VVGDEVELTSSDSHIPIENRQAVPLEERRGNRFTESTYVGSRQI
jgi:hypothetical protein